MQKGTNYLIMNKMEIPLILRTLLIISKVLIIEISRSLNKPIWLILRKVLSGGSFFLIYHKTLDMILILISKQESLNFVMDSPLV